MDSCAHLKGLSIIFCILLVCNIIYCFPIGQNSAVECCLVLTLWSLRQRRYNRLEDTLFFYDLFPISCKKLSKCCQNSLRKSCFLYPQRTIDSSPYIQSHTKKPSITIYCVGRWEQDSQWVLVNLNSFLHVNTELNQKYLSLSSAFHPLHSIPQDGEEKVKMALISNKSRRKGIVNVKILYFIKWARIVYITLIAI